MKGVTNKKKLRFYLLTALAFYVIYSLLEYEVYPETVVQRIINSFFLISYITVLNYVLFEITLPLLKVRKKGFISGILQLAALIFLYSIGLYAWRYLWIQLHVYIDYTPHISHLEGISLHSQFSFTCILFFGIIRHYYNYIQLIKDANQLRVEKHEAELNYLKSQTNPHFLFNTLNNIYSLARDKSDLAPESILRLSKILRFMLYETMGEFIGIEQEVTIITDYIALEKLRYDESLVIHFKTDIEDMKQSLPPLLLIPLVENAFKHGVSETRNKPYVDIQLSVKQGRLFFEIKNSTDVIEDAINLKENIGLSNLRRQLELQYKDYNLAIQQKEAVFIATLNINLESHV